MKKKYLLSPLLVVFLMSCVTGEVPPAAEKTDWTNTEKELIQQYFDGVLPHFDGAAATEDSSRNAVNIVGNKVYTAGAFTSYRDNIISSYGYRLLSCDTVNYSLKLIKEGFEYTVSGEFKDNASIHLCLSKYELTVPPNPTIPTSISIGVSEITLNFRATYQIGALVYPSTASQKVIYSSDKAEKLSVSPQGLITVVDVGARNDEFWNVTVTSAVDSSVSTKLKVTLTNLFNINPSGAPVAKTLDQIYDESYALPMSQKGTCYSTEYSSINGVVIGRTDEKIRVLTDGNQIIQLHTSATTSLMMAEGSAYNVTGYASKYLYKPGFEVLTYSAISELPGYVPNQERTSAYTYNQVQIYSKAKQFDNSDGKNSDPTIHQKLVYYTGYIIFRVDNKNRAILGLSDNPSALMPSNNTSIGDIRFYKSYDYNSWFLDDFGDYLSTKGNPVRVSLYCFVTHYGTGSHTYEIQPFIDSLQIA